MLPGQTRAACSHLRRGGVTVLAPHASTRRRPRVGSTLHVRVRVRGGSRENGAAHLIKQGKCHNLASNRNDHHWDIQYHVRDASLSNLHEILMAVYRFKQLYSASESLTVPLYVLAILPLISV